MDLSQNARICSKCKKNLERDCFSKSIWEQKKTYNIVCKKCKALYSRSKTKYKGVIYIITNSEFKGYCKIGITKNDLKERIRTMRTSIPIGEYKKVFTLDSINLFDDERELHNLLVDFKERGEWFKIDTNEAIKISTEWWNEKYM